MIILGFLTKVTEIKSIGIVGGGPVGLVTSLFLKRLGYDVCVFEKKTWPIDKVCGQGIMPSGVRILKELGVEINPSFSIKGVHYIDDELSLRGEIEETSLGVERLYLSDALYHECLKQNIVLQSGVEVHSIHQTQDAIEIKDKQNKSYSFDYLFCCDGLNSKTRDLVKNTEKRNDSPRMGARAHFNLAPWNSHVEVYWSCGIEAYVTPVSQHKIEVAFLWDKKKITAEGNLFSKLLDYFPALKEKMGESTPLDFRGYGPFDKKAKKQKIGRIYFLGDAYCFLDGITGEGISLGMKSSKYLCHHFEKWGLWHHLRIRCFYLHYELFVRLALFISRHPTLRRFTFKLCRIKAFHLFDKILKINDIFV